MAGSLSDGTTNYTRVSIGGKNSNGAGFGALSVNSYVVVGGGGKVDLFTNAAVLSMSTGANASGMTTGELRLIFQASGISLLYSSGATQYTIGGSATSAAQS